MLTILSKPENRPSPPRCTFPAPGRSPKLLVVSMDGSWAGGPWSSRTTVIPTLFTMISDDENKHEVSLEGVGSDGLVINILLGGIAGVGTLSNVLRALKNISRAYLPGDRIIFSGYSRGAWAIRYLALLIWLIGGLPKCGDEWLYSHLYSACSDNSVWEEGVASKLMKPYQCHKDIWIDALCCFDTVGSLGLPMTGLATPLRLLRLWNNKHDFISNVAPNVRYGFHAVAIHDPRAPYSATLMRGSDVHQVAFTGNHSSMGWMNKKKAEKLICGPLAWMLQQLDTYLSITFNPEELTKHFVHYNNSTNILAAATPSSLQLTPNPAWISDKFSKPNFMALAIMGKISRKPGRITTRGNEFPDLEIHCSVRMRGYGQSKDDPAISGYKSIRRADGTWCWVKECVSRRWLWGRMGSAMRHSGFESSADGPERSSSCSSAGSSTASIIHEAKLGPLETKLLGLSAYV